jgi:hypothetical protein
MTLQSSWAGTDRILIIKEVRANEATFWNHTAQCYFPEAITNCAGTNFERLMAVAVVGRTSRFSMRNPSLELNAEKPDLPLAVLQPGRETLYVEATVNERGNMDSSNAYAIAANCSGVDFESGTVQCSGRYLAPNHPLAVVHGAPPNGLNHLRPVTGADEWGVGPAASYSVDYEGLVQYKQVDGQWTRRLDDRFNGWRVPIAVPVAAVKELRYRILCKADASTSLSVSCGYFADGGTADSSIAKTHALVAGWQVVEGTLPTDAGDSELPLIPGKRNYFRLHSAAVNVARVEAYPARQDPMEVDPPAATQSITAAGNTITPTSALYPIANTTGGSLTLTSAPTMPNGTDGERVMLLNVGAQNIVLQDQGTLAGSNLRCTAATITLTPRDSVEFTYSATVGDWVQTSVVVNAL